MWNGCGMGVGWVVFWCFFEWFLFFQIGSGLLVQGFLLGCVVWVVGLG